MVGVNGESAGKMERAKVPGRYAVGVARRGCSDLLSGHVLMSHHDES